MKQMPKVTGARQPEYGRLELIRLIERLAP